MTPSYGGLNQPYDHYGPIKTQSSHMKKKQAYQDNLISCINIVKIGDHEALTLNNQFIENTQFFQEIMHNIDPNFMYFELKIDKTDSASAMQGSVLKKEGDEEKTE